MGELDQVSWKLFERFLLAEGCVFSRQKGDHRLYTKAGLLRPLVVPQVRTLPVFIVLNNLRVLGVTRERFIEVIKKL